MFESARTSPSITVLSALVVGAAVCGTTLPALLLASQLPALVDQLPMAVDSAAQEAVVLANSAIVP